jgi:AraC family transcriptional activator of pobA
MSQRKMAYYASGLSVSSKYLGQIVVQKTGLTPKTIIDHYVVLQLEFLLRTSSMTVKEIAWNYHFADASFFCRYFKSHTGLTPQDYRRKVLAGEVSRRSNG